MRLATRLSSIVFAIILATPTAIAHADTYYFTFTGTTTDSFSFSLPSTPANVYTTGAPQHWFDVIPVSVDLDGTLVNEDVRFSDLWNEGGIIFTGFPGFAYDFSGPQIFTGPYGTPTFSLGTFTLDEVTSPTSDGKSGFGTLTISTTPPPDSNVPEPTTLTLLGTGVLSLAGAARRKHFTRSPHSLIKI